MTDESRPAIQDLEKQAEQELAAPEPEEVTGGYINAYNSILDSRQSTVIIIEEK